MIKKLNNFVNVDWDSIVEIKQKVNEIIDYLSDKDVNGGECRCGDCDCASEGYKFCHECGLKVVYSGPEPTNPPEQEDIDEDMFLKMDVIEIKDYIQANFLPKAKINRYFKDRVELLERTISKFNYDVDKNRLNELEQLVDSLGLEEL